MGNPVFGRTIRATIYLTCVMVTSGCGSGIRTILPNPASPVAASEIYVAEESNLSGPGSVMQFSASASGIAQPTASLSLPANLLVLSVGTDSNGLIYVGGRTTISEILVYAAGSKGLATPIRTITLAATASFLNPGELTFDSKGNIYIGADDRIIVYGPGPGSPTRIITGSLTQIVEINGIAIDTAGQIYVTSGLFGTGSVLVFSPTATGNVAPDHMITGVGTSNLYGPSGIAIDPNGNLFVAGYLTQTSAPAQPSSIFEFAPGASGFATPMKSISGTNTGLAGVGGLLVDGVGNLYAQVLTPSTGTTGTTYEPSISVFASGASGNVTAIRSFSSPAWTSPVYAQFGLF